MPRRPIAPGGLGTPGPEVPVYVISVAAELTGLHPQTLRAYDRIGLVSPGRTGGGGRRYSWRDIEQLRQVAELTATGIGLEGVKRILELETKVTELEDELAATRQTLSQALSAPHPAPEPRAGNLPVLRRTAGGASVVVWRRGLSG